MFGVAKAMLTTLGHMLFAKPVTIQYPEQRLSMPAWTRGRPRLIYDLDGGDLRCTACGACAIACPVDVIKIEMHPGPDGKKKVLDRFDLDMGGCIECALCVEACPFRAIVMAPDFELASYDRTNSLVFNMHQLRIAGTPEVDAAMEYIQGVKRGLAGQAARGEAPAPGARPAAARPAVGTRPAGAAGGRAPTAGAPEARPVPARPTPAARSGVVRPSGEAAAREAANDFRNEPSEPPTGAAQPADQGPPPQPTPPGAASSGTVAAPDVDRPLPNEPRSAAPGTEQAGQTPAATPAAHPAAAPEAVEQPAARSGPPKPPPSPSGDVPMTPTRMRLGTGRQGPPPAPRQAAFARGAKRAGGGQNGEEAPSE